MNNSECVAGWMHDYEIIKEYKSGVLERCEKCKDQQFFNHSINNAIYLSYHLRMFLQPNNPRYQKEYGNQR